MIWYAIRCAPQRELYAERALREAGCVTFCPTMERSALRRSGRRQGWDVAMLPGYLFVAHVVPWDIIRSAEINGRRLMFGALGPDGTASPIPASSIEAIRKFDGAPVSVRTMQIGDEIRVRFGPHDVRSLTVSALDHGRIKVAMLILGAWHKVEVDRSRVELREPPRFTVVRNMLRPASVIAATHLGVRSAPVTPAQRTVAQPCSTKLIIIGRVIAR